jgi:hypothetical protein
MATKIAVVERILRIERSYVILAGRAPPSHALFYDPNGYQTLTDRKFAPRSKYVRILT